MRHQRRFLTTATLAAALLLTACSGSDNSTSTDSGGPSGQPVRGGTLRVIEIAEPRSLDPAVIMNSWPQSPLVGNALYGTLMIDDTETGEIEYRFAEAFSSSDGGKTFKLKLRSGIKFSDGTPFTTEAVKATWDHAKDPATASPDYPQASLIKSVEVVDDLNATVTLVEPIPSFATAVLQTGLNWIASPESLTGGAKSMDSKPIGAGPYTLDSWARNDKMVLVRNESYHDAERPYADKIEVRTIADTDQRYNTVLSGGADLALEGQWDSNVKAADDDLQNSLVSLGGGVGFVLNSTRPPFDDVRARQAFAAAFDPEALNQAVYGGYAELPTTLFNKTSPYYTDTPLMAKDPDRAQKLFDEVAADGKPVSFTISVFPGSENIGEAVQTQLRAFDNVTVEVQTIDIAEYGKIVGGRDFDTITSSMIFGVDPEPRIGMVFGGDASGNLSGIDDAELNDALTLGRTSVDPAERAEAYATVQERLAELVPAVMYARPAPGVIANPNVGGLKQYGLGSLLPEELWISN